MNDSFRIFRLFGIEVRIHLLFVYMVAAFVFAGVMNGSGLAIATFFLMLFSLVLLHEFGHSLMAQHFGIRVVDIVLWPLGGMARMADVPEVPRIEGWVAIAGPLVNIGLGSLGLALYAIVFGSQGLAGNTLTTVPSGFQAHLALFIQMNAMLGIFNLVPAFPMDGGRLLRAWLARKRPWVAATELAVRVGRVVAFVMILSFLPPMNLGCSLPIIGLFLLWAGARELWATRMRHAVAGGGAFDLTELLRRMGGTPPGAETPPEEPDSRDEPSVGGPGGFTDEDIRRLEQFPGRLRRPPRDPS